MKPSVNEGTERVADFPIIPDNSVSATRLVQAYYFLKFVYSCVQNPEVDCISLMTPLGTTQVIIAYWPISSPIAERGKSVKAASLTLGGPSLFSHIPSRSVRRMPNIL